MAQSICFITAHLNPAQHFVEFIKVLEKEGFSCSVITEPSLCTKFSNVSARILPLELSKLDQASFYHFVQQELNSVNFVVTDIANERWAYLHEKLNQEHHSIERIAYYDNPEAYVPGGYSELAAKVMKQASTVLFANANLAAQGVKQEANMPLNLLEKNCIGLGYYPETEAQKIKKARENTEEVKRIKNDFLIRHGIQGENIKMITYIGGANQVYYQKAFPHFVKGAVEVLEQDPDRLKDTVIILQQHPRARKEGNLDVAVLKDGLGSKGSQNFHFVVSDLSTPDSLAICDEVYYYQTSMAAQFVLAGIPFVAQVGHDTYPDLLIKAGFPSLTQNEELFQHEEANSTSVSFLKKELGMKEDWDQRLLSAFENND